MFYTLSTKFIIPVHLKIPFPLVLRGIKETMEDFLHFMLLFPLDIFKILYYLFCLIVFIFILIILSLLQVFIYIYYFLFLTIIFILCSFGIKDFCLV